LKETYKKKNHFSAASDIKDPHYVEIDDSFVVPTSRQTHSSNDFVKMSISDDRLDFLQIVGRYVGLGAIIPNNDVDLSWSFSMKLKNSHMQYNATKHGDLGFDPAGRMINLGWQQNMSVWIVIAPDEFMYGEVPRTEPGACSGPIHVTTKQRKRFFLFLAMCMARASISNIYCRDPHACVDTDGKFESSTNIL
jgi:hypothetical protein